MEYTKIEVLKVLEYYFEELKIKVEVKIKKNEDGSIFYNLSHYYKPKDGNAYYTPGGGATSVEDATRKVENYLKEFTSDYVKNEYF